MSDTTSLEDFTEAARQAIIASVARVFLSMLAVLLFASVQGFRFGFLSRDYRLLAVGSVVSVIAAFTYGAVGVARANGRSKHVWMLFAICSGWLPYCFMFCLIGYRGLWRFVQVFRGFSLASLLSAVGLTLLGFFALRHLCIITDVVRGTRQLERT